MRVMMAENCILAGCWIIICWSCKINRRQKVGDECSYIRPTYKLLLSITIHIKNLFRRYDRM